MCKCNKNTSRRLVKTQTKTKTKTKAKTPARRSRTRTRKPKYLSLSKHIKTKSPPPATAITEMPRQLKNLFPLHPENLVDDRSFGDENVALLFHSDAAAGAASLAGLLRTASASSDSYDNDQTQNDSHNHGSLVNYESAMKRNGSERDASEEKWVCYSEVVEEATSTSSSKHDTDINTTVVWRNKKNKKKKTTMKKEEEVETTSSSGNTSTTTTTSSINNKSLSLALKLDYQGILNAWSDKGSLFIQGGDRNFPSSPQTVPDLQYDLGLMDGWGSSAGNLWTVPESGGLKIKEEMESKDGWKLGQREASVLRYKEKRQSRLFSKRIRYEVRKLNAEKRPRMKGRFVKIS